MIEFSAGVLVGFLVRGYLAYRLAKKRSKQIPLYMLDEQGIHRLGNLKDLSGPLPPLPPPPPAPKKQKPHLTLVKK